MQKILPLFLTLALVLGLCACGQKAADTATWQEQYDLGVKYLSEGNYEEAIIAFNAAIEIDPKRPEAYLGLADVYIARGDLEQARAVLESALPEVDDPAALETKLAELMEEQEDLQAPQEEEDGVEEILDEQGQVVRKNYYEPDGTLSFYTTFEYDESGFNYRADSFNGDGTSDGYTLNYPSEDGLHFYSESFDSEGESRGLGLRVEDEGGHWVYSASLDADGNETIRHVAVYDEAGNYLGWDSYDENGKLFGYVREENGTTVYYDPDGTETMYSNGE